MNTYLYVKAELASMSKRDGRAILKDWKKITSFLYINLKLSTVEFGYSEYGYSELNSWPLQNAYHPYTILSGYSKLRL